MRAVTYYGPMEATADGLRLARTYRECDRCQTRVPYQSAIYRLEQIVGSRVTSWTLCWLCLGVKRLEVMK